MASTTKSRVLSSVAKVMPPHLYRKRGCHFALHHDTLEKMTPHSKKNARGKPAYLVAILALGLAIVFLATSGVNRNVRHHAVSCPERDSGMKMFLTGVVRCDQRGWRGALVWRSLPAPENDNVVSLELPPSTIGTELSFDAQSPNSGNIFKVIATGAAVPELLSFPDGLHWNAAARAHFILRIPPGHQDIKLIHPKGSNPLEFYQFKAHETPVTAFGTTVLSPWKSGSSWGILGLGLLLLALSIGLLRSHGDEAGIALTCLLVWFTLITLFCGTPYGAAAGFVDAADDTSYTSWAFNIGYLLDPNLSHGPLLSWARTSNHHSWGTGLMLAPGLLLLRLIEPGLEFSNTHLGLMSFQVVMLTCLSLVLYFWAFRPLFGSRIAAFIAILTLISSSLLKWTYIRNIFSHAPEAFAFSLMTLCASRRYLATDASKSWGLWGFLGAGILAVQIRRENILLLLLPILFEFIFKEQSRAKLVKHVAMTFIAAISSLLILQATNLWTEQPYFWQAPGAASYFKFATVKDQLAKQWWPVLFGSEYGYFAFYNTAQIIGALAICHPRFKLRRVWPFILVAAAYLLMCMSYEYPNGFEWQNRFLLKLNPIMFAGLGFLLRELKSKAAFNTTIAVVMAGSAYEIYLYLSTQIPFGMNLYAHHFTDNQLLVAARRGPYQILHHLPLIAAAGSVVLLSLWQLYGLRFSSKPFGPSDPNLWTSRLFRARNTRGSVVHSPKETL